MLLASKQARFDIRRFSGPARVYGSRDEDLEGLRAGEIGWLGVYEQTVGPLPGGATLGG
jgi:hypothetical protein